MVLNTKINLGKFDTKSREGISLRYSTTSKVYKVYNKSTLIVEESMRVLWVYWVPDNCEDIVGRSIKVEDPINQ